MSDQVIGVRSRASKVSQKCVGRNGWIEATWLIASRISLAITMTKIAAMTAIACWVNVESARPSVPSAVSPKVT